LHARDPRTGAELEPAFAEAGAAEVDAALRAADAAWRELRDWSGERRAALLERIAEGILALGDELIARAEAETALPAARLTGERARTVGQLRMFAALAREGSWVDARIDPALPSRQPAPRPDLRRMLRPLGPTVVFGASNFPLAFSVAGGDTASALAAGNPVVVKAHPSHPGTAALVGRVCAEAVAALGLPSGAFALLHGASPELGAALVRHPLTRAGVFTGSLRAGRALADLAAARPDPIPFFAEMGSTNPVFVLPGAARERGSAIAEGLHRSLTLGVGQFCTNPGLTFVVAGAESDAFLARLAALVAATPAGTMLNGGIGASYRAGVERLAAIPGARVLARVAADGYAAAGAALLTVDAATFRARHDLREEVFGPCGVVVQAASVADLAALAAALPGQLTATLHASAAELDATAAQLLPALERIAGRVLIDDFPTGVEVCHAMHHGGPYPASSDARFTSVGAAAIERFARPVCYQNLPERLLPPELRDANPLGILRLVEGRPTREPR
jgi:NADP-dependent aldehyde dehydrogenase